MNLHKIDKMVKGILFDYGGTIDTNGLHWGGVLWDHYQKYNIGIPQEAFSMAYSFGERSLAINPLVKPEHTFYDVLGLKIEQQFKCLADNGFDLDQALIKSIAKDCDQFARSTVNNAKLVLDILAQDYPLVMVSNFYGNLNAVLSDFGIRHFFEKVVESAVVGVRKPNPEIYQMGVVCLGIPAAQCVVVGDSYSKDIQPGKKIGCKTIWLNVKGWEDSTESWEHSDADLEISDFGQLNAGKISLM